VGEYSQQMMKDAGRIALTFIAGLVVVFGGALTYSRAHGSRIPVQTVKSTPLAGLKSEGDKPAAVVPRATTLLKEQPPEISSTETTHSDSNSAVARVLGSGPLLPISNSTTTLPIAKRELGARVSASGSALTSSPRIQERTSTEFPVSVPANFHANSAGAMPGTSPQAAPQPLQPPAIKPQPATSIPQVVSSQAQTAPSQAAVRKPQYPAVQDQAAHVEYKSAEQQPRQITGSIVGSVPQPAPESVLPEQRTRVITVEPGTPLSVRISDTLSSDRNRTGNTFSATLASPLVVNGFVVARAGSTVLGRVVSARKAPVIGGRSELTLALTNITTADGKLVRIDTSTWQEKGAHSSIVNTAKMATGAAVGAVVGAVTGAAEGAGLSSELRNGDRTDGFMATRRTVVLPAGMEIQFSLATPLTTTEKINREAE
jgi:hypothetical protein